MNIDKNILKRYTDGNCTADEKILVEQWFEQYHRNFDGEISGQEFIDKLTTLDRRMMAPVHTLSYWKLTATAAAILLVGIMGLLTFNLSQREESQFLTLEDIKAPASSNAVVVLEDNTEYSLDSLRMGDTLRAKGYLITKLASGELRYINQSTLAGTKVYNTLRTKAGGIAHVLLSDGTLVWLNANSELTYPINFGEGMREVYLKGEGYFEVAKNNSGVASQQFFVRGEEQTIQVLGTKFNANFTERNETALLEGKVAIAGEGSRLETNNKVRYTAQLMPNQVYQDGDIQNVKEIERYIDWKEGYFDLSGLTLYDLAQKLSGWYGIEVVVDKGLEEHHLFGRVGRSKDLKELLELVAQASPVEFSLKNHKVYIYKTNN